MRASPYEEGSCPVAYSHCISTGCVSYYYGGVPSWPPYCGSLSTLSPLVHYTLCSYFVFNPRGFQAKEALKLGNRECMLNNAVMCSVPRGRTYGGISPVERPRCRETPSSTAKCHFNNHLCVIVFILCKTSTPGKPSDLTTDVPILRESLLWPSTGEPPPLVLLRGKHSQTIE